MLQLSFINLCNESLLENIIFSYDGQIYNCSLDVLLNTALEGSFLLNYQVESVSSLKQTNTTFEEFLQLYEDRAARENVTAIYWTYIHFFLLPLLPTKFNACGDMRRMSR